MLTMTGFVSLAAPAHEGTATLDRVTMTSVGAATQWGVTVRVVVGVGVEGDWLKKGGGLGCILVCGWVGR